MPDAPTQSSASGGRTSPGDSELERLLDRSRRGDAEAWRALVARLQALVYSVPVRYRLTEEDAADVFITTFEALYRNLDRIESGRAMPRWLATTAARESLRLLRLKDRSGDVPLSEILARADEEAEREAAKADDAHIVRGAIRSLPSNCRRLLEALFAEDEPSYAEVAEHLGMAVGAIGPRRARCLERLRKIVEEEGFFG